MFRFLINHKTFGSRTNKFQPDIGDIILLMQIKCQINLNEILVIGNIDSEKQTNKPSGDAEGLLPSFQIATRFLFRGY